MPESLHQLERRRAEIVQKIAGLGDLRAGSITTTQGKSGKPTCHCAEPDHPGHGPFWRLTYKTEGRTHTQSLPSTRERHKVEAEVAEFRRFQQLSRDFQEVNTAICQLRSVDSIGLEEKNGGSHPTGSSPRDRTVAWGHLCRSAQIGTSGFGSGGDGHTHRDASSRRGAVLKELLQKPRNEVAREVACPCGEQARFHEMRPKQILTVCWVESTFKGPITFVRTVMMDKAR